MMEQPPQAPAPVATDASPAPGLPALARAEPLASDQLFQGRRIVEIAHNGEVYRLQSTRLGKLILTK
jgi:hemin uptake protein HemP